MPKCDSNKVAKQLDTSERLWTAASELKSDVENGYITRQLELYIEIDYCQRK